MLRLKKLLIKMKMKSKKNRKIDVKLFSQGGENRNYYERKQKQLPITTFDKVKNETGLDFNKLLN